MEAMNTAIDSDVKNWPYCFLPALALELTKDEVLYMVSLRGDISIIFGPT